MENKVVKDIVLFIQGIKHSSCKLLSNLNPPYHNVDKQPENYFCTYQLIIMKMIKILNI